MADALDYWNLIEINSTRYGVNPLLIAGIVQQESGGNPQAKSSAGALGLMQLMPETAEDLGVTKPFDPVQNIRGGVSYFASLLKRYKNNVTNALLAYNWGMGNVDAYLKTGKGKYGQSLPSEAKNYPGAVISKMNNLESKKDTPTGIKKWFLEMPGIKALANAIGTTAVIETDGVGAAASGLGVNPADYVESAGNFALRSVVVLAAVGLIVLGFYFMFEKEISQLAKGVTS